jgi:hypothetical protein
MRLPHVATVASVGCLVAHITLLALTGASLLTLTLPMLVLSALCAGCAVRSWGRRCTTSELVVVLCTGSAMLAAHLFLAPMHGSLTHAPVSGAADLVMHGGLSLAVLAELVAAGVLAGRLLGRPA